MPSRPDGTEWHSTMLCYMHTSVYILYRQKIIVSAAELAVRPSVHPSLLETFIFGLESAKKGIGTLGTQ